MCIETSLFHRFLVSGQHHSLTHFYIQQILRFVRVYELLFAQQMPVCHPPPPFQALAHCHSLVLHLSSAAQELFDEFTRKNISPEHYLLDWYAPPSECCGPLFRLSLSLTHTHTRVRTRIPQVIHIVQSGAPV
jgi:hypothetical protein